MKKLVVLVSVLALASWADAATVVLKGGKRLEVQRFEQRGGYLIVQYANGRLESYAANLVDLAATREANGMAAPTAPARETGPHSPFFGAQAGRGATAVAITDADVQHITAEEGEGQAAKPEKAAAGEGAIALLGYQKKLLEDGQWEITATVANTGKVPVQNVTTSFHLLDREGKEIGSGTAAYAGQLAPGEQGAMTSTVGAAGEPTQVSFEFQWQVIRPVAKPAEGEAGAAQAPAGAGAPAAPPAAASPLTQPPNPMAIPPVTAPPADSAPQVPPPTPTGKG